MCKSIVRYLRRKAIKNDISERSRHVIPKLSQPIAIGVLMNDKDSVLIDETRQTICGFFHTKSCVFFTFDDKSEKASDTDKVRCFVGKRDLNLFGLLNKEAVNGIKSLPVDMLIDVTKKQTDDLLLKDYMASQIDSSWKVSFASEYSELFDMVIAPKDKSDIAEKIGELYKYLSMLLGNK